MLKEQKVLTSTLSTIWVNIDCCEEQYRCASALYLMSVLPQCFPIIIDWGIGAHGNCKEVINGISTIDKRFIYQLMSNVQLPGSKTFDSHIIMHSCIHKNDFSLAKQFQKYLSKEHRKHGVIDQETFRKRASKRKWAERDYFVQDISDVAHKDVKMYFDTNQFPELPFCGPHPKPRGSRGLRNHYRLRFDPKIGHGICAI